MQDRYMVRDETLSRVHPQHPGATVFRVYDRKTQTSGLAYFTSWEAANKIVEKKNGQVQR